MKRVACASLPEPSRRLIISAAAAGVALLAARHAIGQTAKPDQLDQILASRLLRVAVPKDLPPFGFMKDGAAQGYDVAIARMLAHEMRVRLETVPVTGKDRLPYLTEGKVDLIIASLCKAPEHEKLIDYSIPYAPNYLGVFGPAAGANPDPEYFKGRKIGVTHGSMEEAELLRKLPGAEVVRHENQATIVEAYLNGQIEYIAAGNAVVEAIADSPVRTRTRRVLTLKDSPCCVGLRKNETRLLARVNRFVTEAGKSQALSANALVWLKTTVPPDFFAAPKS